MLFGNTFGGGVNIAGSDFDSAAGAIYVIHNVTIGTSRRSSYFVLAVLKEIILLSGKTKATGQLDFEELM